jgi:hypothetical protein
LVPDYVSGPLGRFYYPNSGSSTSLTNLVNTGSRNADAAGLYHFTTRPDQQKETNSVVEIGFHYPAAGPPPQGLLGCWKLDETTGTVVKDSSANAFHGTLPNGGTWTDGYLNSALSFDGVNDQVSVPDSPALRPTTAFSIAFWLKKNSEAAGYVRLAGKGATGPRNFGVWDDTGASGYILFQYFNTTGGYPQIYSSTSLSLGRWYHVACTWDGSIGRIYIDGQLDNSGSMSGTPLTSADPVTLGYAGWNSPLPGLLDEVCLYNRALSPNEVSLLAAVSPADQDGDTLPDYLEDRDGDGLADAGETSWQTYNSPNGLTGNPGLQVHTPLRP